MPDKVKISVRVITRSKRELIEEEASGIWKVYLHTVPEQGKANERLRELIAEHLDVSKSAVRIVRGETSKHKIIEVANA